MKISEIIVGWYKKNRRDLPWRSTSDIYKIWLSEVILQQTRVQQGLAYYERFIEHFPNLSDLACADEEEVIKLWQGLGYYSRARNLHAAAKQVANEYDGLFPSDYKGLLKLKGVGKYTAAAIASIGYSEPVAVVDGNVSRVLSRLFAVEEAINTSKGEGMIQALADQILDHRMPGDHNQALMEFGALQCVPSSPNCLNCPLSSNCMALQQGKVASLPLKLKKVKVQNRYFIFLMIKNDGDTYIMKREKNDIWKNMYQFPLIETDKKLDDEEILALISGFLGLNVTDYTIEKISGLIKHQLTHRNIFTKFIHIDISQKKYIPDSAWIALVPEEVSHYPLPRLIDRYLDESN